MRQAKAFTKNFPEACKNLGVEPLPLQLDRGEEGQAAFLRLIIQPGCAPGFSPVHVKALVDSLLQYSYLQRLAFWSVPVGDAGCKDLGQFLVANRTLTTLELTDCAIGPLGCKFLGEALERNATLITLRLDHNINIGAAGAEALGECLKRNVGPPGLQTLSLTFCGLHGEEGGAAVTTGLLQAPMLKVLELKGNRFGVTGLLSLLRVLKSCTTLFHINLSDTGFGKEPEVHAALEECWEANTTCCEYALAGNMIGDTVAYRWLTHFVRKKEHMIYLDVTNQLDPLLFKQIGDATTSNKKEWTKRQKKKKGGKGKKARAPAPAGHSPPTRLPPPPGPTSGRLLAQETPLLTEAPQVMSHTSYVLSPTAEPPAPLRLTRPLH